MSEELCLNDISTQAKYHRRTEKKSCKQCDNLSQNSTSKAILSFVKRLRACVKSGGGHFEHVFK